MAAGWSVVLEDGAAPATLGGGKALLYYQRQIDDLARTLGVTPLSEFFSRDPRSILAYLRDQGVEPDPEALPEEEWFEAADGLAAVRALAVAIAADPSAVPQADKVLADLDGIAGALEAAGGSRFHLGRDLDLLSARGE